MVFGLRKSTLSWSLFTIFFATVSCSPFHPSVTSQFQYAWILSRTNTLDQATYDRALQAFINNNIDVTLFHATYQGDDCPYFGTK